MVGRDVAKILSYGINSIVMKLNEQECAFLNTGI